MTSFFSAAMPSTGSKNSPTPPQHQYVQNSSNPIAYTPAESTARRHGITVPSRSISHPRNMQTQRKSNKPHRRPRLQDDEDALAEHTAIRATGSRRGQTSITHLMSFALPPRPTNPSGSGHRLSRRAPTWGVGSGYHAADKSRYIHANYRFIIDPSADFSAQSRDADAHIDWDHILQILAAITDDTSCPICLGPPVAPRLAKCGHIFCLACIIRYLHSTDENSPTNERRRRWKPCPICFDSVFMHELKPVRWTHEERFERPREGQDVVLRLMMRRAGSTLALPRELAESKPDQEDVPWHFAAGSLEFARLMKGTETYMLSQYDYEIESLQTQEEEDTLLFGDDAQWSRKAIASVRDLKEKIRGIGDPDSSNLDNQGLEKVTSRMPIQPCLYFYQAPAHSYLSPLDIRILKATFGDFSSFPSTILPRVEHISTDNVVDEEMRKRAKYLAHLPLGHEINFLECDWTDIVSEDILQRFQGELERRRQRNLEKAAREEKARIRAEQTEDKKLYGGRRLRSINNDSDIEASVHEGSDSSRMSPPVVDDFISTSGSPPWAASTSRQKSSFAALASLSTSPSSRKTVWGTPAVESLLAESSGINQSTVSSAKHDGWLADWERDLVDEEHMLQNTEMLSLSDFPSEEKTIQETHSHRKKKKKKITLMSTNGQRAA